MALSGPKWFLVVQTVLSRPTYCKVVQLVQTGSKISYGFVLKKFQKGYFLGHPVSGSFIC